MFPWLQALTLLEPLLSSTTAHPHVQAAQSLASVTPTLLTPSTTQAARDQHLGQILQLLLSSGLISAAQVPAGVTVPTTPAATAPAA